MNSCRHELIDLHMLHPCEMLKVSRASRRYRKRRSAMNVYASAVWLVVAAIIYIVVLRPEGMLYVSRKWLNCLGLDLWSF